MAIRKSGVLIALLIGSAAVAQPVRPGKADIAAVAGKGTYRSYPEGAIVDWERDLREALSPGSPESAAVRIAGRYGFPPSEMRRLIDAWVVAQARQYGSATNWRPAVRAELLALAPSVRRAPLGLTIVAEALGAIEDCAAADFDALMAGATDVANDAYLIATASACTGNFNRAVAAAGDRAMPVLIRYAKWGALPPRDTIALYAWLTSPAALARVADADRMVVSVLLWREYLAALLKHGFDKRALALLDAMPEPLRVAVLSADFTASKVVTVDGIAMTLIDADGRTNMHAIASVDEVADNIAAAADRLASELDRLGEQPQPVPSQAAADGDAVAEAIKSSAPISAVAEALAAAGRTAEARWMLARLPGLAAAKAAAACLYASDEAAKATCPSTSDLPMRALVLDHLLNTPELDPYPIAEVVLTNMMSGETMASAAIRCLVFPEEDFPGLCAEAKASAVANADLDDADGDAKAVAAGAVVLDRAIPGFRDLRATFRPEAVTQPAGQASISSRASVVADYPAFVEQAVPAEYRGNAKGGLPKGLAALPEGFDLVRAERQGQRAVAISVSQTYDPTGEISHGGYWVHLSDDAGAHWQRPLYTGLADRFPYVVGPSSRLPLIDGDILNVAVDIAEIDTATISYPPVALRTRRRAQDRYIAIPLADLQRDGDGDGLTDLAAHHLLLDRPKGSGTPFVVGSDRGADCQAPPSPDRLALIGLLGKLTDPGSAAIVEPVDRAAKDVGVGWQRAGSAIDQPLFILGRPGDYACLRSARPMIVYDKDDIPLLERFTPAFHAFQLPPIMFNRARNRGYVRWSTGWAGGTYRLRLVDGRWEFDTIQSWIT